MNRKKHPISPPKWADKFLEWYCRPELLEEIQGDAYELFNKRCEKKGVSAAKRRFIWDILRSFRLSTIKHIHLPYPFMMFQNNFKIAWRHLLKQKSHSLINVLGLATGLACCMMIGLYINHELSYDKHHPKGEQVYRVLSESYWQGKENRGVYHNPPLAEVAVDMFPEIANAFRLRTMNSQLIRIEGTDQNVYEEKFIFADQSMLDILELPFKYGDPTTALTQPNSIIITESKADAYFYGTNPVGRTVFLNNNLERPFQITGVLQDAHTPSHIKFDFYLSMEGLAESKSGSWTRSSYITYFLLKPEVDIPALEEDLGIIATTYKKEDFEERIANGSPYGFRYKLQPIGDVYLFSEKVKIYGEWAKGDVRYIWLMGTIAIFILLIAIINFVNLSTAKSTNRAKEVGVRKVLGSFRSQLIGQFLTESMLLSLFSMMVGLLIAGGCLPLFQTFTGMELTLPWRQASFVPGLIGGSILIGLLAGIYPAFYMSAFQPVKVLKGKLLMGNKGGSLRSMLVVGQFTASIVLIIATILVYQQMSFIQQKKLGFNKEQVLILEDTYSLKDQRQTFKQELQAIPEISHVSFSSYLPVDGYLLNGSTFQHPDTSRGIEEVELRRWFVDEDYIPALDMQLLEGRNFTNDLSLDTASIILNEAAVKMLGFENPIGMQLKMNRTYTVIGVVENFHFRSMKEAIIPLGFHRGNPNSANITLIKTTSQAYQPLLEKISKTWYTFSPTQTLRYHFLDERFDNMYASEKQTGQIFGLFASLAILIACLGLFALATFMGEQRMKEISIRKILGASVSQIFGLLTHTYLRLILISLILAIPIGWYMMHIWLQDFVYRINIGWQVFALAGILAIGIAIITVSYQAIKVALSNPAEELRME